MQCNIKNSYDFKQTFANDWELKKNNKESNTMSLNSYTRLNHNTPSQIKLIKTKSNESKPNQTNQN